jgi:glutamyl endopeptidase
MPPTPTGPHTPITNTVTHEDAAAEMISLPTTGVTPASATETTEPTGPVESLGESQSESVTELVAPNTDALRDVGAASFADPAVVLETVHGVDNRIRVSDPSLFPYRVNASLLITARDGSQWVGTAWFISGRTLATAAHCVYIKNSGIPQRDGWVKSIQVMPGRNGKKLPYGSVTSTEFWTVQGWATSGDENFDYGAIIIPTPLGDTVGTFGFASYADATLKASVANVTGYPGDKPSGTLWYDTKQIAAVSPTKVHYDIDTAGGQSGAAVYVIKSGKRIAVAVHAYGGPTTNSGTRISASVFTNLSAWKK